MKLSEFNFDLPTELIAEYPSEERDESRLMVINRNEGTIEHKEFKDIFNDIDFYLDSIWKNDKINENDYKKLHSFFLLFTLDLKY